MKLICRSLFIFFVIFFLTYGNALASHMLGGQLTYQSLGNERYEIFLKVYVDCGGQTLPAVPSVNLLPLNCSGSSFSVALNLLSSTDITHLCPAQQSKCSGGSYQYGIMEGIYSATVDLSSFTSCCSFSLSFDTCCRSSAITTGPGGVQFYTFTTINKCIPNSSPVFSSHIPPILCAGQDFCYSHGARDTIDHDSLSYSFDSVTVPNTSFAYASGYSYNKPLMFLGSPNNNYPLPAGMHLDSVNGDLCFRPVQVQIGVVILKVSEWRRISGNVTLVGETRTDMQIIVTTCPNNKIPAISGPNDLVICAGKQACFEIESTDLNVADSVQLSWNKGIQDATFTAFYPAGSKKQKAIFCWTPDSNDVSNSPFTFTVTANDGACPLNGKFTRVFRVTVKENTNGTATRSIASQGCMKYFFDLTPSDTGTYNYEWLIKKGNDTTDRINARNFIYAFNDGGRYFITLSMWKNAGCAVSFTDTLDVDSLERIVADFTSTSAQLTFPDRLFVQFQDISSNVNYRKWDFGDNTSSSNTSTLADPNHTYYNYGIYSVKLRVADTSFPDCADTITKVNYIEYLPPNGIGKISAAPGIKVFPNPVSGSVEVLVDDASGGSFSVSIFDIHGKQLKEINNVNKGLIKISCEDLSPGVYIIRITGVNGMSDYRKFMVE